MRTPIAPGPLFLLPRAAGLVDGNRVITENSSEAAYSADSAGRRWIRKRYRDTGFQPLLAEAIGWFIARELGVPVPDGAVVDGSEDERSWLSGYIEHASHWDPARAHFIDNINEFGAMLALDAVIYNGDRHGQNILLTAEPDEHHLKAWAIDVGNAYVGQPLDFVGLASDAIPPVANLARRLPLQLMVEGALDAASRATLLASDARLPVLVQEACGLVLEPSAAALSSTLTERLGRADSLTRAYIQAIESKR